MKILFLTRYSWPHVGGVEKHVEEISQKLKVKGQEVKIISEKDIKYPHIKFLGLAYIWFWLFRNRSLIERSEIVHCHDVFIWYLPLRFLYPKKPVYSTFHGWEGIFPIPLKNVFLKRLTDKLSWRTIAVGHYIEKWYGIKADIVIYGGTEKLKNKKNGKMKDSIVYVGRLEGDTGLKEFLKWLDSHMDKWSIIDFVGDGSLRKKCRKYGKVHGFTDPKPFLAVAEYCVPGGYLSYIEAKSYGCNIKVFPNNPLKKDYWKEIEKVKKFHTWNMIADLYLSLWRQGMQ